MFQGYNIADALHEMEWYSLDLSSKKLLLILIARCTVPLEIKIGYIIPVNIQTFLKVRNWISSISEKIFLITF